MIPDTPNKKDKLAPPYFNVIGVGVLLSFIVLASIANATSLRFANLGQINSNAKYIFLGKCIQNTVEQEQQTGFIVTYSTFQILDSIKGKLKNSYTIKQIGGTLPGGMKYHIEGVPGFKLNEEYVLFLPQKSKLGFSSPIALSQGQFSVRLNGNKTVSNGKEFSELLKNVPNKKLTLKAIEKKKKKPKTAKEKKKNSRMELKEFKKLLKKMAYVEEKEKKKKKKKKDKDDDDDDDDDKDDKGDKGDNNKNKKDSER